LSGGNGRFAIEELKKQLVPLIRTSWKQILDELEAIDKLKELQKK
jgi:hypothetical protein